MNNRWAFFQSKSFAFILLLIQVLFLIGLALSHYATVWVGKEIQLRTVPIDPRDMMYGDYAVLQYEISTLPFTMWTDREQQQEKDPLQSGTLIYVVLAPEKDNDDIYALQRFSLKKLSITSNEIMLKAKVEYQSDETSVRVKYGLEKYYLQENTGEAIEEQARQGQFIARVKISPWSSPVLTNLSLQK